MFRKIPPIFLFIFVLFAFSLFAFNFSSAAEAPTCQCTSGLCCDGCNFKSSSVVCDSWLDYGCPWGSSCSSDVGKITYFKHCSGSSADCNGSVTDNGWSIAVNCSSWQTCNGATCQCAGSCLNQPTNLSPSNGEQNVKLPVALRWDPVPGAGSYRYKIDGVLEDYTTNTQKTIDEAGTCLLKSNTTYNWGVQSCCNSNGTNCGSWSSGSFKTSSAPQLVSPENNIIDIPIPTTLNWCDVNEAQSYYLQVYKNGELYYPIVINKEDDTLLSLIALGPETLTKSNAYDWEIAICFNENGTKCGISCSSDQDGEQCGDYSQRWRFATGEFTLPVPEIVSPKSPNGEPIVNFSDHLGWKAVGVEGVSSYHYEIKKESEVVISSFVSASIISVPFGSFWENLAFNQSYSWKVKSCWDEEGEKCETEGSEAIFKTTGAKPTFNEADSGPANGAIDVVIPVKLNWDNMPGAASYYYEVATDSGFSNIVIPENQRAVKNSEVSADYPNLHQDTLYYWRVKTCADEKGEACGDWNDIKNFRTFILEKPINPAPADGSEFYTYEHYLGWGITLGAKFYQYKVDYGGAEKIPLTIVPINSAFVPIEQLELGEYSWYVRACLDKDCHETGDQAGPWYFILKEQLPPAGSNGIVPCGRYVNVNDPYGIDERQPCQFKDIFLLLRNIIDFVLWRLGLIVLAILVMATGFIFYFSMGAPETMTKVKSVLKSAGTGYLIVFLSWTLIDIILKILGYKVGLPWWHLQF